VSRTNKKPAERKAEMLLRAKELFWQKGFQNTTVDDIVKAANVAKGTFYYYFQTKEDVLEAIIAQMEKDCLESVEEIIEKGGDSPVDRIKEALDGLRAFYRKNIGEKVKNVEDLQQHIKYLTSSVEVFSPVFAKLVAQSAEEGFFSAPSSKAFAEALLIVSQILLDRTIFECSDEYYLERTDIIRTLLDSSRGAARKPGRLDDKLTGLDESFALISGPYSRQPLKYARESGGEFLVCDGERYPIVNGVPVCYELSDEEEEELREKENAFPRRGISRSFGFDAVFEKFVKNKKISAVFTRNPDCSWMDEIMEELDIFENAKVLGVSVGSDAYTAYLLKKRLPMQFWGVDLSIEALQRLEKEMRRGKTPVHLAQCSARALPYRDGSFDAVFHVGDISPFDEDYPAILEMIRVAKPGARIVIASRGMKRVKKGYQRISGVSNEEKLRTEQMPRALMGLLPCNVRDIRFEAIDKAAVFKLSFLKFDEKAMTFSASPQ
jgi:AcrR family transcriptional regulator/SAM-dependent methyltransferase